MRFSAILLLVPFTVVSCVSHQPRTNPLYSEFILDHPVVPTTSGRGPTSAKTDYIGEIEQAKGKTISGWIAGRDVVDAKARMEKIFEFARTEPQAFFADLREKRPIFVSKGVQAELSGKIIKIPDIYLITKYRDVQEVLDHNSTFSVRPYKEIMDATVGAPYMLANELTSANEEKPHMHQLVDGRKNKEKVRRIVAHLAQEAIKKAARNGQIDVAKDVTRAVPIGVNEEYFGFNGPNPEALYRWSHATQHAFFHNPFKDEKVAKASEKAGREMREYLRRSLIPSRKKELENGRPANDVVSQVLKLSEMHKRFGVSDERIVSNIIGLLVGSVETTTAAMSQSLQVILSNPQLTEYAVKAAMNDDDELMSRIVWEALRFDPVNPWLARYAETDYVLNGTVIPKGSLVLASTESAMHDKEVFPEAGKIKLDRDMSKYMHLGYGYHRCLGDDVSLIMVPETVKQILKLKNVKMKTPIDQKGGPFPESFVLSYDASADEVSAPENKAPVNYAQELGIAKYINSKLVKDGDRRQFLQTITNAAYGDDAQKEKAITELPALAVRLTADFSAQDKIDACMDSNPQSKISFTNVTDRQNYCSVRLDFRTCYFANRLLAKQSGFTSYYRCAYGQNLLTESERKDFRQEFSHLESFYFLQLED